jgi:hypothetical protein
MKRGFQLGNKELSLNNGILLQLIEFSLMTLKKLKFGLLLMMTNVLRYQIIEKLLLKKENN